MTPPNIHVLQSALLTLPVAAVLTRRMLLHYKSPALIEARASAEKMPGAPQRANGLMEKLKNITGYSHYGLNE